jgi:diamine N-acetyltransferase
LQGISQRTFVETFAEFNSKEDMELYLHHNLSLDQLTLELTNPSSSFFLAFLEGQPVAYLKLNVDTAQTEVFENTLEIERIYVLKAFIGKHIGQQMFDFSVQMAIWQKRKYLWLAVWEENDRAIRFYEKNGLLTFGSHVFWLGSDEQVDLLMKKELL